MSYIVHPGDKSIPSRELNKAFAAAGRPAPAPGGVLRAPPPGAGLVVRNAAGSALDRFSVVGIDGVAWTPTDNEDSFVAGPVLDVTTPTTADHRGRLGILTTPLADGELGRAVFEGTTLARVVVASDSHRFADVKDGDATALQTTVDGAARILWMESSGSTRWAIVAIAAKPVVEFDAKITSAVELVGAFWAWKYAWAEQERTATGWSPLTGGRTGTTTTGFALNRAEAYNTETGIQGNGIDLDGSVFTDNTGLEVQPIRGGRVVRMTAEYDAAGGVAYSFDASNAVDGECG